MTGINLVLFEPDSDWKPKLEFPSLSGVKRVSIDLETKDPYLLERGPGSIRRDGYPVGIAFATDSGFANYYPMRHELGGNLPSENVINFFIDLLKRPDIEVVGSNTPYDLEWLRFLGIKVAGRVRCIQIAEALIDEESEYGYNHDALCKKYLGTSKDEELYRLAAQAYGLQSNNHADLWKLHSKYVGSYATYDAKSNLEIYAKQIPLLTQQNLWGIFDLECDLMPLVLEMRLHGVRIDIPKAEKLAKQLREREEAKLKLLRSEVGFQLDVWSGPDIEKVCKRAGYQYQTTEKGNPSFDKIFLKNNSHNPFFKQVGDIRNLNRLRKTYVEDLVFKNQINGRIHCMFNQTRKDDSGTRSGRFSSSDPNLQQIPSRDKEVAPLIRSLFIPEEGEQWCKLDYSQQEPRILTHYGYLMKYKGAAEVREAYMSDKTTDFYPLVARAAGLERKPAKDLTLGICYGEGKDKIANDLGVSIPKAVEILGIFNTGNPYVQQMADAAMKQAEKFGYIKTMLGRRCHFDYYEPTKWPNNSDLHSGRAYIDKDGKVKWKAKKYKEALTFFEGMSIKRAFVYKALNRLIQGSAADMTKEAMRTCYRETKRIPLLTVHDELDYSVPGQVEASGLQYRMENCVDCSVPIYAELDLGKHWK
jgi:DNA polymerase I-like protein with 3'-5' exonuclease and polymerase domains